jgi:hypothetical protein
MSDQPDSNLRSKYEANSSRAEWFARLILVGLAVEIVEVFVLKRPFWEAAFTIAATTLILVGVWGEIIFEKRAREAGDGIVAEANARVAEAELRTEQLRASVAHNETPRGRADTKIFLRELCESPPAVVSVIYDGNIVDGFSLAITLRILLDQAGWHIDPPTGLGVMSLSSVAVETAADLPVLYGVPGRGSPYGIAVVAKRGPRDNDMTDPVNAVAQAIFRSGADTQVHWGVDDSLPDNFIKLIVGHKARAIPMAASSTQQSAAAPKRE